MRFAANTTDDLLRKVYAALLKSQLRASPTKGDNNEIIGAYLQIKQPRNRISRAESRSTLFSALGELFWYLSGDNDGNFIDYYIPGYLRKYAEKNGRIHGGYGPRLFNMRGINQLDLVIQRLKTKRDTRRAVIQLYDASDIADEYRDVPCTCTIQFLVRRNVLHMVVHMRSNDAFLGLPHDIFCFTMIQEIVCRSIDAKLGYTYTMSTLTGQRLI